MSNEPTLQERAAIALATLTETMPTQAEILAGAPVPEWMGANWLAALTDPDDPRFADSVLKAEAWLATR